MDEINTLLKRNLPLHVIIENEVRKTPFGQITVNVQLRNGIAMIDTINISKTKRKKYDVEKEQPL